MKITLSDSFKQKRTLRSEAEALFIKFCKLRNLREQTIKYYKEDIHYFFETTGKKYLDEITQEVFDDFLMGELDKGKKTTSLNSRLRGLRVFFKFCHERGLMEPLTIKLMKEDAEIKEPYTIAELQKLLKRPTSKRWVEYRNWAMVNYLVATGNRAGTVINIKIKDVDFEGMTIHLTTTKNRKQQIIPLAPALKTALEDYLSSWKWSFDDYLFPSTNGTQLALGTFQESIRKYNIERGVSKTSLHLFRHTFAKEFILAGGGMVQLQMLLGHSTLDMTRHYVNLYASDLQKNYERFSPLDNIKNSL